jgi:acyl dehydratase
MTVAISATNIAVGDTRELVLFDDLSRTRIVMYAGASGDYNPIHSDERFAKEIAGYPSVFAHGMLTMGATGRIITDWFGADRVVRYSARFVNQVWPGDLLTSTATVAAVRDEAGEHLADLSIVTVNGDSTPVLTGTATVRLEP